MEPALIVAIDGPAGAGKSTVARRVAKALGYLYLDTGAMYRAVALKALLSGLQPHNAVALTRLAQATDIRLAPAGEAVRVLMDGQDVTNQIRDPAVGAIVAQVAGHPGVRSALGSKQRDLALTGGTVLEGRDTASCIVPEAQVKVYLTADATERVARRHTELQARGMVSDRAAVAQEITQRDHLDTTRAVAPLVKAPGAHLIDSTHLTLDQVVKQILDLCHRARLNQS